TTVYDAASQIKATVDQLGNRTTFSYDNSGNQTAVQNPLFTSSSIFASNYNRLIATQSPDNFRVTYTYDLAAQLLSTRDARGNFTTYSYDNVGRQRSIQDALGNVTTNSYNLRGDSVSVVNARGAIYKTSFDAAGR